MVYAMRLYTQFVEKIEPDLAAGRERGNRVPEPREGNLADDGDCRGVKEIGDLGAGDGDADDDAAVFVDQEAARPAGAVTVERAAGVARCGYVDDAHAQLRFPRGPGGVAGRGDLRIGEDHARRARAVSEVLGRHVVAENVAGGDRRLVLGHVGEWCAPVE